MTGNGSRTLRRYEVRTAKDGWLATVVIADDGYFSTVYDYGSYAYWWSDAGPCFRSFLVQVDTSYLLCKIASKGEYDDEATRRDVLSHIVRLRRRDEITSEKAREEWDRVECHGGLESYGSFCAWASDADTDMFCSPADFYHERPNRDALAFCEKVLPMFQQRLREELASERVAAEAAAAP